MSADIHFGEIEEAQPSRRLRPDQDLHYAVAACQRPREDDLPIYVYLDAMLDMESHASSDTRVELGGVLLGGQYEDDSGRPFVVIRDCLRAEHYEATKGSFKFTHETWEQITRQREQFEPEFEMVGWYHTHPDWGVFLSGMDMFICDNFFNRSLDVALVIDPCRDDRGWFQWTGNQEERVRRTNGFYLIASRHRKNELEHFATALGGEEGMSFQQHSRSIAGHVGPSQPIINLHDRQSPVQTGVLIGLLMIQFIIMIVFGYRMLMPLDKDNEMASEQIKQQAVLQERLAQMEANREQSLRAEIQKEVLDQMVASRDGEDAIAWSSALIEERARSRRLAGSLDAQLTALENERQEKELVEANYASSESRRVALAERLNEETSRADQLDTQLRKLKATDSADGASTGKPFYRDWRAYLVMVILVVVAGGSGGVFGVYFERNRFAESQDEDRFEGKPRSVSDAEHLIEDSEFKTDDGSKG